MRLRAFPLQDQTLRRKQGPHYKDYSSTSEKTSDLTEFPLALHKGTQNENYNLRKAVAFFSFFRCLHLAVTN